jgi:hypothetical protein
MTPQSSLAKMWHLEAYFVAQWSVLPEYYACTLRADDAQGLAEEFGMNTSDNLQHTLDNNWHTRALL